MSLSLSGLSDLGELLQSVRDPQTRSYVSEAISAHYGGAQRAAIVSLWIAVTYDIVSKARELALGDDRAAADLIRRIDAASDHQNVKEFQDLESRLLTDAYSRFEFIDYHEHADLDRLRIDRNRCAHPAFASSGELFQPTPELVRAHIVHAIQHLFRHQPVQGKSALNRMVSDIASPTFPSLLSDACTFINARYLDRAKPALVRNAVIRIVKALLRDDDPDLPAASGAATTTALVAIGHRHPVVYEVAMRDHLPRVGASLAEDRLAALLDLAAVEQRVWDWLDEPTRIRLKQHLLTHEPGLDRYRRIGSLLNIEEMWPTLIQILSEDDKPPERLARRQDVIDAAISRYRLAGGYRVAEAIGESLILPLAPQFSPDDVVNVLDAVSENGQIWAATRTPRILGQLFDETAHHVIVTRSAWIRMVERVRCLNGGNWAPTLGHRLGVVDTADDEE